jgi:short-subunit dehydrogenase
MAVRRMDCTPTANSPKTAAITGAGGGLGASFARQLAQQGYRLLLIDRRGEPIVRLCQELRSAYGVQAEPWVADLTDRESIAALGQRLVAEQSLDLLVNGAGFGFMQYLVDIDVERHLEMISVHVIAPMSLCHAVLPGMIQRNRGAIINIASLTAWTPSAGVAQYAATKAYVINLSASVADELRGTNVRIQTLCPGFTTTGFHATDTMRGFEDRRPPSWMWMTPDAVVTCSLRSIHKKSGVVIPGWHNRVLAFLLCRPLFAPLVQLSCRLTPAGRQNLAAAQPPLASNPLRLASLRPGSSGTTAAK